MQHPGDEPALIVGNTPSLHIRDNLAGLDGQSNLQLAPRRIVTQSHHKAFAGEERRDFLVQALQQGLAALNAGNGNSQVAEAGQQGVPSAQVRRPASFVGAAAANATVCGCAVVQRRSSSLRQHREGLTISGRCQPTA